MSGVHYDSCADARAHLEHLLDAAENGRVATIRRDASRFAVVDVGRLRDCLVSFVRAHARVVSEGGGWSVSIPGLPVAADGTSFDDAITEMIDALREYAEDWHSEFFSAENHRDNWGIVQLISLTDDEQLRRWLVGGVA